MGQPKAQHRSDTGEPIGLIHPRAVRMMGAGAATRDDHLAGHMAANAIDAGARSIKFRVERHGKWFECEDDGAGMPRDRWPAMIGMGDPGKLDDEASIGENGTAHTTYWLAYNKMEIWTAWADDPHCYHLAFTFEEAWEACRTGRIDHLIKGQVQKASKAAKIKSAGCIIRLSEPYEDDSAIRVRAGSLRRNLARQISPWQLDMVTINDKKPKVDFPKGEFYRQVDNVEGVGQVEIIAGFADKPVHDKDRSWGTWGAHVCDHDELGQMMPDRLKEVFLPELGYPQVWFMIRVRAWKRFEGKHTRRFFKRSLFSDPSFEHVVRHVNRSLVPSIRKHIKGDALTDSSADELIANLVTQLGSTVGTLETTDGGTRGRKSTNQLVIKPGRVELLAGQSYVFEVRNSDPDATYRVDGSRSGGAIKVDRSYKSGKAAKTDIKGLTEIHYKAGEEQGRRYILHIIKLAPDGSVPSDAETARSQIIVVTEHRFSLTPHQQTVEPGETFRVRTMNDAGKDGLTFEFTSAGRLTVDDDGRGATGTAPMEPGDYRVTVTAKDGSVAEGGRIRVQSPSKSRSSGSGMMRQSLTVDGVHFEISPYPAKGRQSEPRSAYNHAGNRYVLWFNFQCPESRSAAREGILPWLLREEILSQIAEILEQEALRKDGAGLATPNHKSVRARRDNLCRKVLGL